MLYPTVPIVGGSIAALEAALALHELGGDGVAITAPKWTPPSKIAARYLEPYLDELDHAASGTG